MAIGEDRALATGAQLARVHDDLRRRLRTVRAALDTPDRLDPGTDLLAHCLGFCHALRTHHTGEDGGMFVALRDARPDLGPFIDKLVEDHRLVDTILRQVQALVDRAAHGDQRDAIGRELDGLAAIMESHFGYEERRIGDAIHGLPDNGWSGPVFRPL